MSDTVEITRSERRRARLGQEEETQLEPKKAPEQILLKWRAKVKDTSGKVRTIRLKARNRSQARQDLDAKELQVLQLNQVQSILKMDVGGRVPLKTLLHFTRQLAAFSTAGISILDALALLSDATKNSRMKSAIAEMIIDVREGDGLAKAASNHPDVFPDYYVSILHSAEQSGDLAESVETLANYLERDVMSLRATKSALYYPAILMVLGIAAVIVMTVVVLPQFQALFDSLTVELPPATALLLAISEFMEIWWPVILAILVAVVVTVWALRRTDQGAYVFDSLLLKMPVIGKLLVFISLERLTRILGSLVEAGVPLPDALSISSTVMGNKAFERGVLQTRDGVIRGQGLSGPLRQAKIFPNETVQLFQVGENSGRLAEQLGHAARYYAGEVDYRLKNFTSLIEPVVLIVVGGGIGFIAVALVSAMYGIYSGTDIGV